MRSPLTWFDAFVAAVQSNDIRAGRQLFADDALGFGTLTARMTDLDSLEARQWRPTWAKVVSWEVSDVVVLGDVGDDRVVVTFLWLRGNRDGVEVHGRGTLVLDAAPVTTTGWQCRHSHFSEFPADTSAPLASP